MLLDEWWVSLRALPGSDVDLTEIVKHFGNGGGHAKASGTSIRGKDGHALLSLFKPVPNDMRFDSFETPLTTEEYMTRVASHPDSQPLVDPSEPSQMS